MNQLPTNKSEDTRADAAYPGKYLAELTRYLSSQTDKQSAENLTELYKLFSDSEKHFATFIGAGVSRPLGIKDWPELMKELLDMCGDEVKAEGDWLSDEVSQASSEKYMKLADQIYDDIGRESFVRIIDDCMSPRKTSSTDQLRSIAKAVDRHLTTNLDHALPLAYRNQDDQTQSKFLDDMHNQLEIRYIEQITDTTPQTKPRIYYLHADLSDAENPIYVLRSEDYRNLYDDPENDRIERCLRNHYESYSLVFVGFSFVDDYVKQCFERIAKKCEVSDRKGDRFYDKHRHRLKQHDRKHFLVTSDDNPHLEGKHYSEFHNRFNDIHIYPIVYKKSDHIFVQELFEYLRKARS